MAYKQLRVIGGKGNGPDQFREAIHGIAIDRRDRLYVAGDKLVRAFDADGKLLHQWTTAGDALSVAVAADGSIFAGQQSHIEIFNAAGKRAWQPEGLQGGVTCIGFANDDVLIADAKARSIRRYDKAHHFLNTIGKDNRTNGFLIPNGAIDFAVAANGVVHAANPGKHRVEQYALNGRLLGHVGQFGGLDPAGFQGCCNPTNVALTREGRFIVSEKAMPRVKALDAQGKLLGVIATDAFDANAKNMDLAVDSRSRIYAVDTARLCVLVFEKEAS